MNKGSSVGETHPGFDYRIDPPAKGKRPSLPAVLVAGGLLLGIGAIIAVNVPREPETTAASSLPTQTESLPTQLMATPVTLPVDVGPKAVEQSPQVTPPSMTASLPVPVVNLPLVNLPVETLPVVTARVAANSAIPSPAPTTSVQTELETSAPQVEAKSSPAPLPSHEPVPFPRNDDFDYSGIQLSKRKARIAQPSELRKVPVGVIQKYLPITSKQWRKWVESLGADRDTQMAKVPAPIREVFEDQREAYMAKFVAMTCLEMRHHRDCKATKRGDLIAYADRAADYLGQDTRPLEVVVKKMGIELSPPREKGKSATPAKSVQERQWIKLPYRSEKQQTDVVYCSEDLAEDGRDTGKDGCYRLLWPKTGQSSRRDKVTPTIVPRDQVRRIQPPDIAH